MNSDDGGPASAEVGPEEREWKQNKQTQQLPLTGAASTQLRCRHREADHLSGFEHTNHQRVLEDPEHMWPPVTVEAAVDADDLERGRLKQRDAGPDEQLVAGHRSAGDLMSDIDRGGGVQHHITAVRPDRLWDVERGEMRPHALCGVEVQHHSHVVERLGECADRGGQHDEGVERRPLAHSHPDRDCQKRRGQSPADVRQDRLHGEVQLVIDRWHADHGIGSIAQARVPSQRYSTSSYESDGA